MAKSKKTIELEKSIWSATAKMGVFGCFEVTIGWSGKERVDYLTYDTKGIWRCYEVKVSKADFYSKASHTFVGHYNYYVMTQELFDEVKDEIPSNIGIYIEDYLIKKAKKQALLIDEQVLKDSMIRSLYREAENVFKGRNPQIVKSLRRQIAKAKKETQEYRQKYWDLMRLGQKKFGTRWYKT